MILDDKQLSAMSEGDLLAAVIFEMRLLHRHVEPRKWAASIVGVTVPALDKYLANSGHMGTKSLIVLGDKVGTDIVRRWINIQLEVKK